MEKRDLDFRPFFQITFAFGERSNCFGRRFGKGHSTNQSLFSVWVFDYAKCLPNDKGNIEDGRKSSVFNFVEIFHHDRKNIPWKLIEFAPSEDLRLRFGDIFYFYFLTFLHIL